MAKLQTGFLQDAGLLLRRGQDWAGLGGDALAFVLSRECVGERWLAVVDAPDQAARLLRGLRFFHPEPSEIALFPADDHRPYDGFSPDPELPRQRQRALRKVEAGGPVLVVTSVRALMQRIPDRGTRRRGTRILTPGETLDRDVLVTWLADAGYLAVGRVDSPGSFAIRGDIIDVWPAGRSALARLDFFDDEIEEIRKIDPETGRAADRLSRLVILPAREERLDATALDRLHSELGRLVGEQGRGVTLRRRVYEELRAGVRFSAVEDWLPALVPTEAPLEPLGGLRQIVVLPDDVQAAARDFDDMAGRRWQALEDDERPLVPPHERFVSAGAVLEGLAGAHRVYGIGRDDSVDLQAAPAEGFAVRGTELGPVVSRINALASDDVHVALVVDSEKRADRLLDLLDPYGMKPKTVGSPGGIPGGKVSLIVGDLPQGFVAPESGWAFIPVAAMFGGAQRARKQERLHNLFESSVTSMAQLKAGDPVVHRMHGIGKYHGLQRLPVSGVEQDFVKLEYRGGDLLFLPVTSLEQLSSYTPASSSTAVKLDRLGGTTWSNRRGKVRDNLLKMAQALLRLYARREIATRPPHAARGPMYRAFETRFPYIETPDQATAIEAVQDDLSTGFPMDRLVCGDVGFGKTEVAMRAAMRVVEAGHQVAILCPTTVLAYQHFHSFEERFEGFPVTIGMLSRFCTPKEENAVVSGLRNGSVDIVVGTTAVLGRRVQYKSLGLMVIDEEHRFGVKQKDRLKKMRTEVDILTMSATPIPRTLQMALSGIREMSIMATPPADRLAVRTTVARMTETRVRDAIRQELERGGQCFVIHNRVQTIENFAEKLREWVPDARFSVAHGQMEDRALEEVLVGFLERASDVLVCTSIIESGIDIPSVNTLIVHRADMFGLSQLYQLRGRVGRANVRAKCILLTPEVTTPDSRKRLRVLVEHTRLGSGFNVAAADLELRGGGNLLGSQQSGNIDKVGYDVWVELLQEAVAGARGDLERDRIDPEVEVPVPAFIPDKLVPDVQERLTWYKRLSSARSPNQVDAILDELEILAGDLPPEARNLGNLIAIRLQCREYGVVRCTWLKIRAVLELHPSTTLDEQQLVWVVKRHPKRFTIRRKEGAPVKLEVRFTPKEGERPFRYLRWVFAQFRQAKNEHAPEPR